MSDVMHVEFRGCFGLLGDLPVVAIFNKRFHTVSSIIIDEDGKIGLELEWHQLDECAQDHVLNECEYALTQERIAYSDEGRADFYMHQEAA